MANFSTLSGLSVNHINATIYKGIRAGENNLQATMAKIGNNANGNITQADMLHMQQEILKWSMMVELQSTLTKQVSDSLKGVIQKAA
jgi:type III secretion protein F